MHRILRTTGSVLLGTAAAALFVTTIYGQSGQSILGKPSPANHFIETPAGWVHPKTAWGEPDLQAMLNMMQANSLGLERCAGNQTHAARLLGISRRTLITRIEQYDLPRPRKRSDT